eukprot:2969605-Rhodomonas_salina.4
MQILVGFGQRTVIRGGENLRVAVLCENRSNIPLEADTMCSSEEIKPMPVISITCALPIEAQHTSSRIMPVPGIAACAHAKYP